MQAATQGRATGRRRLLPFLSALSLSEKMKYAIKAALSLALVYGIAFSQGWNNGMTAATTIIFIAVTDSLGDSILKGMFRVTGTVTGSQLAFFLFAYAFIGFYFISPLITDKYQTPKSSQM